MPPEPHWLLILVYLAGGFLLLAKGADWLVEGSSKIAARFGISTLIIGMTVVAFGTSAPEIVVSGLAAWEGAVDLSLGNVLGSNIANIGLVLGVCGIVLPRVLEAGLGGRELFWLTGSLALLWYVAADGRIPRSDAIILLVAFVAYNLHLAMGVRSEAKAAGSSASMEPVRRPVIFLVLGLIAISVGARLVLDGAVSGARLLDVPSSVIGLTIVAIGTSLPELAAGLGGALKGDSDISLGNVVGSNVFNLLGVIGIVGLIQPLDPDHARIADPEAVRSAFDFALTEDLWIVFAFSAAAVTLPALKGGGRWKGGSLLIAYVLYNVWLFSSRG